MGPLYSVAFGPTNSPATATFDAFEVNAPSDAVYVIHSIYLSQDTDYGDAAAEGVVVRLQRYTGTSGSGGSTVTPEPVHTGSAAAGDTTVEVMNTTIATTLAVLHTEAWNVQIGWAYRPTPEEMFHVSPSGGFVVEVSGQADAIAMCGTLYFAELGG